MEIWSGTTWKRKEEVKNPKRMFKKKENWKYVLVLLCAGLLAGYLGGFFEILLKNAEVNLNPLSCLMAGLTTTGGRKWTLFSVFLLLLPGSLGDLPWT